MKYQINQQVEKTGGQYGGPGIVRGVMQLPDGTVRYIVAHKIEGGYGELLHIYSESNLKEAK